MRYRPNGKKFQARRLLAACSGIVLLSGCSGGGSDSTTFNVNKGWLDPTAVGNFEQTPGKHPLVVPILSTLEKSVDVGDDQFANATDIRPEDLQPSTNDYTIGRNDLISVSITDLVAPNVETVRTTRVSEGGMISLPLIEPLKVVGLTEAQTERAIAKSYKDANLIQNANVSVSVTEARARSFSILGAVTQPGQYAILNSEFRLLDAMVLGRDVTSPIGIEYVYVIRQLSPGGADQPKSAAPTTQPPAVQPGGANDVLTPRSAVPTAAPKLLQTTGMSSEGAERYITVDGKQVKVTPGAAAEAPAAVAPVAPVAPAAAAAAVVPPPTTAAVTAVPATMPAAVVAEPVQPGQAFEFRDPASEGKTRVIRVPFEKLRAGDLRSNIIIKPYDLIFVPQPAIGEYYMGGHVARVGVYSLTARKITLKQAIVSAGMFDQLAIPSRTDVIRRVGDDKEVFVTVDLDKVFSGSQPDIFLKPNDVVSVGTNWAAPFLASIRGAFRMTYGFGFLYDRNFADYNDQFGLGGRGAGSTNFSSGANP